MNTRNVANALNAYGQVDIEAAVMSANPVQIIVMLYDGAIGAIAKAKGMIQQQQLAAKSQQISLAIGIIEGLAAVLDKQKGGEIAENLAALYDYMKRRLLMANLQNDEAALDEVASLLLGINEAWRQLANRPAQQAAAASPAAPAAAGSAASHRTA